MTKSPADQGIAAAKADDVERAMPEQTATRFFVTTAGLLGRCVHYPRGWMFLSNTSDHGCSRRYWPSAYDCVPSWARHSGGKSLSRAEWETWNTDRGL